jgi:hypothetical protein
MAAFICVLSSAVPLGTSGVELQMGLRVEGMPPLDIRPGFQEKFRSLGRVYFPLLLPLPVLPLPVPVELDPPVVEPEFDAWPVEVKGTI